MLFRQAEPEEFDRVMRIIEDGRAALADLGIDQWQGGSPNERMVRKDMEAGCTMVAVLESQDCEGLPSGSPLSAGLVVGTLAFIDSGEPDYSRMMSGEWIAPSPNSEAEARESGIGVGYATLHRLAVSADAKRRGVASFMVRASMQLARERGLKSVRADTHEGNIPMQRTFESCGMTRCCEIELSNENEPTRKRIGYEIVL